MVRWCSKAATTSRLEEDAFCAFILASPRSSLSCMEVGYFYSCAVL